MSRKRKINYKHIVEELKKDPKEIILLKSFYFDSEKGDIDRNRVYRILENNQMEICKNTFKKCETLKIIQKKYPLFYGDGICGGFDVPKGWLNLVDEFSGKIEEINKDLVKQDLKPFRCNQIKEKFAALRIYVGGSNAPKEIVNKVNNLLNEYEIKSKSICEISGEKGAFLCKCNGWFHTLTQESLDLIGGEKIRKKDEGKTDI